MQRAFALCRRGGSALARPAPLISAISRTAPRPSVFQQQIQSRRCYSTELDPANAKDYDAYVAHWRAHFQNVEDDFELERGLNHIFAQDWAPSVELISDIIKACRKLNTFATAVRTLEALENKVHKKDQYTSYLTHLKPLLDELGVVDKHALGEIKAVRQKIWWADA